MLTEEEKRMHRCCFTGHRPEKLNETQDEVLAWLRQQILCAIESGFTTFISGMAMGVDLWAAQIVLELRKANDNIHLIAATPWPGFATRWKNEWKTLYQATWDNADYCVTINQHYHKGVFQQRNIWMVDHSDRVIAYFNGSAGGTKNTIEYARQKGVKVFIPYE